MGVLGGGAGNMLVVLGLAMVCVLLQLQMASAQLAFGFYAFKCSKDVEKIITDSITASFNLDNGIAPGILRMHFHDAFVGGADGSVLPTSNSTNMAERDAPPNRSLRGFEAIFAAKAAVEVDCPGLVSCADVLTFAARDAVVLTGGPSYALRGGRRDAFGSLASNVGTNLPSPISSVDTLIAAFAAKGLSQDDMVVLSGAHTIGIANCRAFTNRLYPTVDPTLNATRAMALMAICPTATTAASTGQDIATPFIFDNSYYKGLRTANGIFQSDQNLWIDSRTNPLADTLSTNQVGFFLRFRTAMRNLGEINVLTGIQGQIKIDCSIA